MALAALNTKTAADQGILVDIVHPSTQIPLGIRFRVLGTDSDVFRRISREQQRRQTEKQRKSRGIYLAPPEEQESNGLELLTALTIGWEQDIVTDDKTITKPELELNEGEFIACTPENIRRIYSDPGFSWLKEQVDSAIGDRRSFLQI